MLCFAAIPQLAPGPAMPAPDGGRVHADDVGDVWNAVEAARGGDAEAFGELYDLFHHRIHRYALARVGWNPQDADDVCAETFIDAWRAVPRYRWTGAPFASWLFTICARRVAMHHRSARRHTASTAASDLGDAPDVVSSSGDDPAAAVVDRVFLARALDALPRDQRQVLELRFFATMTTAEIAATVERSDEAVRQIQVRALRALRTAMTRQEAYA